MFKFILFLFVLTLLTGCGTRIDSMARTMEYAIFGEQDVDLSPQQIDQLKYPYQYLTVEEQPRIALALGFDDNNIYKWLSGQQEVLTTYHGRIINAQGLANSLVYVEDVTKDPLACIVRANQACRLSWQPTAFFGRSHDAQSVAIMASFERKPDVELQLPSGKSISTELWQEVMAVGDEQWRNYFWISKDNRRVVKSEQQWAANRSRFTLIEVKAYSNDLRQQQGTR